MRATTRKSIIIGLAAIHAGDAVACAAKAPPIMKALDRVGCEPPVRSVLPAIKIAAAAGLAAGIYKPVVGRVTSRALVAYFGAAVAYHLRAKDSVANTVPAVGMGLISAVAGDTLFN